MKTKDKKRAEAKINKAIDAMMDLSEIEGLSLASAQIQRILDALNSLRNSIPPSDLLSRTV